MIGQHWTTTGVVEAEGRSLEWEEVNCNADAPQGSIKQFLYGKSGDGIVPGDWNGNGTVTPVTGSSPATGTGTGP